MLTKLINLQGSCSSVIFTINFQQVITEEKNPIPLPMEIGLYTQSATEFTEAENSQKDLALLGLALNTPTAAATEFCSTWRLKSAS